MGLAHNICTVQNRANAIHLDGSGFFIANGLQGQGHVMANFLGTEPICVGLLKGYLCDDFGLFGGGSATADILRLRFLVSFNNLSNSVRVAVSLFSRDVLLRACVYRTIIAVVRAAARVPRVSCVCRVPCVFRSAGVIPILVFRPAIRVAAGIALGSVAAAS
jgi:hypothetical protein